MGVGKDTCDHCHLSRTKEGHDGCIGTLEGVANACCGHGNDKAAYVQFFHDDYKANPNKVRLSGDEAIEYINKNKKPMQKENLFIKDHVRTRSGQYVNILNPDPNTLMIEDIAHALAHTPRFGGHLATFYSVAQHSILGSHELVGKLAFDFLMHDASEAYLVDIPSPLKAHLPEYKKIEHRMMLALAERFGFTYPFDPIIKIVDKSMLQREWDCLMLDKTIINPIYPTAPSFIKKHFLSRYHDLKHY